MHVTRRLLFFSIVTTVLALTCALLLWDSGKIRALFPVSTENRDQDSIRLVLHITIDQLRGDMIQRYSQGLGNDGFRFLIDNGVVFSNAQQRHANTETVAGHATLSTGADPSVHGMVANNWRDKTTSGEGSSAIEAIDVSSGGHYATADSNHPLIFSDDTKSEPNYGRSPHDLLSSTIGDAVKLSLGPTAKVFGVSAKDRASIALTGHAGNAYWYIDNKPSESNSASEFVSSTFYMSTLPDWVKRWNREEKYKDYANTQWTLLLDESNYHMPDDVPWEVDFGGYGVTFPHDYGGLDGTLYKPIIRVSPAMDELTLDFAKTLIDEEGLGQDDVTDYLAISFNGTDYIGHAFGPSSREAEDHLKRLDRILAKLFEHIEQVVGMDRVLIAFASDHGATEVPQYLKDVLRENAGEFDFGTIEQNPVIEQYRLSQGIEPGDKLSEYIHPYLYLSEKAILEAGLNRAKVATFYAGAIQNMEEVAYAYTRSDITAGRLQQGAISKAISASFNPHRSGDIYIVLQPRWFHKSSDPLISKHGTPWAYDTHIPMMFYGPDVVPQTVSRRVEAVDLAATIATYLGIKYPSGTQGIALPEVLDP